MRPGLFSKREGNTLHNLSGGGVYRPGLNESISIWLPLTKATAGDDNYLYCGWLTSGNERWGAIWRYKNVIPYTDSYYDMDPDTRLFVSPNYGNAVPFKFSFASPYNYNSTSWTNSLGIDWQSGNYPVSVDENPVFLKFAY